MKKKLMYEVPDVELIELKAQGVFMASVEGESIQSLEYDSDELNC